MTVSEGTLDEQINLKMFAYSLRLRRVAPFVEGGGIKAGLARAPRDTDRARLRGAAAGAAAAAFSIAGVRAVRRVRPREVERPCVKVWNAAQFALVIPAGRTTSAEAEAAEGGAAAGGASSRAMPGGGGREILEPHEPGGK